LFSAWILEGLIGVQHAYTRLSFYVHERRLASQRKATECSIGRGAELTWALSVNIARLGCGWLQLYTHIAIARAAMNILCTTMIDIVGLYCGKLE
jgi:hypothetical protein